MTPEEQLEAERDLARAQRDAAETVLEELLRAFDVLPDGDVSREALVQRASETSALLRQHHAAVVAQIRFPFVP